MQIAQDIATCMYYTGIDPFSGQEVYIARALRDRKLQRALMQFFKPRITSSCARRCCRPAERT